MPPEVKVRLAVEGTPEAIAAFRAVQSQAHSTATTSAKSFSLFSQALSGLKTMVVSMVGVFALGRLAQFGREVMDVAERLGNLAEELGTSVEEMSSLSVVATMADSDLETLAGTMGSLAKNVDALKSGSPTAVAAFARLGLSARDFAGNDTAQWFETVALKMDKVAAGGSRTAVALALMGRNGRAALPIMKGLADVKGLSGAEAQARGSGLFVDASTLANVRALGDEMKTLRLEAQGAALSFVSGFGPFALQNMRAMAGSVGDTAEYFRSMGEFLGRVLSVLRAIALTVVLPVGLLVSNMVIEISGLMRAADAALHGRWGDALNAIKITAQQVWSVTKAAVSDVGKAWGMVAAQPESLKGRASTDGRAADVEAAARADATAAQRLARQKQAIAEELKAIQEGLSRQEEAAKRSYERGRIDLGAYYAIRRETVEKGLAAELAALEKERGLALREKDPTKRSGELERIAAAASRVATEAEGRLAALRDDESAAINDLAKQALEWEKKILEAQGKTQEARQLEIALELNAYRQFLTQLGLAPALIEEAVQRLKTALIEQDRQVKRTIDYQELLGNALGSWLGSAVNQVENLADAFRSLGLAIAQALQQALAMQLATTFLDWIGGKFGGKKATGGLVRKATGGLLYGPGTDTSDSIILAASRGEYIVRAAAVRQAGALPFLEGLNAGRPPALAMVRDFRAEGAARLARYAEGGLVPAQPATARAELGGQVTIVLPPGVEGAFHGPEEVRRLLRIVSENPKSFRKAQGIG